MAKVVRSAVQFADRVAPYVIGTIAISLASLLSAASITALFEQIDFRRIISEIAAGPFLATIGLPITMFVIGVYSVYRKDRFVQEDAKIRAEAAQFEAVKRYREAAKSLGYPGIIDDHDHRRVEPSVDADQVSSDPSNATEHGKPNKAGGLRNAPPMQMILATPQRLTTIERLNYLVSSLRTRSNINLWAGVSFSLLGVIIIFIGLDAMPQIDPSKDGAWIAFFQHYVPRVSLVLLIEGIAFFFLRMYRATLEEMKYVHNELTNVEMQHFALLKAIDVNDKRAAASCIQIMSKTDRNSTLKKGETTVELERARLESSLTVSIIDKMPNIMKMFSSKSNAATG